MKYLAIIQTEFLKEARNWDDLSLEEQKSYLKRHPKSKRKITAKPKSDIKNKIEEKQQQELKQEPETDVFDTISNGTVQDVSDIVSILDDVSSFLDDLSNKFDKDTYESMEADLGDALHISVVMPESESKNPQINDHLKTIKQSLDAIDNISTELSQKSNFEKIKNKLDKEIKALDDAGNKLADLTSSSSSSKKLEFKETYSKPEFKDLIKNVVDKLKDTPFKANSTETNYLSWAMFNGFASFVSNNFIRTHNHRRLNEALKDPMYNAQWNFEKAVESSNPKEREKHLNASLKALDNVKSPLKMDKEQIKVLKYMTKGKK